MIITGYFFNVKEIIRKRIKMITKLPYMLYWKYSTLKILSLNYFQLIPALHGYPNKLILLKSFSGQFQ